MKKDLISLFLYTINDKGYQKKSDQFYKCLFLHNTVVPFSTSFLHIKASALHAFPIKADLHLGEASSGSCELILYFDELLVAGSACQQLLRTVFSTILLFSEEIIGELGLCFFSLIAKFFVIVCLSRGQNL